MAVLFGLTAILHASAVVFNIIKYAGIVYLLYMAWQFLREKGTLALETTAQKKTSGLKIIRDAILVNILNPKLSIFFLAFLPQFIDPKDTTPLVTMTILSVTFMLMTQVVFIVYGVFAGLMRENVINRPVIMKWMRRSFAAAFGLLAARLAWAQR
ncbi:LysE family translocator [Oxalobacter vibrioformis]|uniref:LysE family translocator n=1 Tax=Oxalobacter vibrioformis TaxID=933080 RepID=A0A9E9LVS7_9BURK|nr:LysE family translocator [Oxalobacter vibrioformis]WAW09632.1 LysE family translocator [Oxalobacter vibrioformis]